MIIDRTPRRTIVAIDDNLAFLGLLRALGSAAGYMVVTCSVASTGLASIKAATADLAIIDLHMPPAADWYVLDQVKRDPATWQIPVIVCSGSVQAMAQRGSTRRGSGCVLLPKPFELGELLVLLDRLLVPPRRGAERLNQLQHHPVEDDRRCARLEGDHSQSSGGWCERTRRAVPWHRRWTFGQAARTCPHDWAARGPVQVAAEHRDVTAQRPG
jgi:twitching motility two-component system response regulator PilH